MKIDWKRKLTSRKFWVAVTALVTMTMMMFGFAESTATQVAAIIMQGATVAAYIIGEGLTDAASITGTTTEEATEESEV